MSSYTIALAQYPIEALQSFAAYELKVAQWVQEAAEKNAKLLVFPEYGAMELVSLLPEKVQQDLQQSLHEMQQFLDPFIALHTKLAAQFGVYILASSFPVKRRNVAYFFAPNGQHSMQEKIIMTRFEREEWRIEAGKKLHVFDTALGKIGIAICYDSEFPLLVRALAEAGAGLILVPSCTDTLAGFHRVKIGAQARALENQCYVAQSPTVGEAKWSPATDINIGAAGLYGPPDVGFPDNGIIAEGVLNKPSWLFVEIHPKRVQTVRNRGVVRNFTHWAEQASHAVEVV